MIDWVLQILSAFSEPLEDGGQPRMLADTDVSSEVIVCCLEAAAKATSHEEAVALWASTGLEMAFFGPEVRFYELSLDLVAKGLLFMTRNRE